LIIPEQDNSDLNKNNENPKNTNYNKLNFINPLSKNNNETIFQHNPLKSQTTSSINNLNNKNEGNIYQQIYNNKNNDYFQLMTHTVSNSSINNINNYSFNIQNGLNFNNDKICFNNNTINNTMISENNNRNNFSNSLASKLSTDTYKVLDNFDNYLNQYEEINIISNNSYRNFNNNNENTENMSRNRNNLINPNIKRNCLNNDFICSGGSENGIYSKNSFVLDKEMKNGLIKLNDSRNNLFNLNENKKAIIDLSNENDDFQIKLTNNSLEEILINCKDEQIQRELLINKSLKKKQKQNNFI